MRRPRLREESCQAQNREFGQHLWTTRTDTTHMSSFCCDKALSGLSEPWLCLLPQSLQLPLCTTKPRSFMNLDFSTPFCLCLCCALCLGSFPFPSPQSPVSAWQSPPSRDGLPPSCPQGFPLHDNCLSVSPKRLGVHLSPRKVHFVSPEC